MPAYYLIFATLITFIAIIFCKETQSTALNEECEGWTRLNQSEWIVRHIRRKTDDRSDSW
jgi:hypothetical protein